MRAHPVALAVWSLAIAGCPSGTDGSTDGGADGGGADGGISVPLPCTPGGFATALADVSGPLSITYTSNSLIAPGSDPLGSLVGLRGQLRLGLTADPGGPDYTQLRVFGNGCEIGKLTDFGEEWFWTSRPGDEEIRPEAGTFLVIEVEHEDDGIVYRRSYPMPQVMPALTEPARCATITGPPTQLTWTPMGLDQLPEVATAQLSATAWFTLGGGAGGTDGYTTLVDADGTLSWFDGAARWTSIQLQARLTYEDDFGLYLGFHLPVNCP